MENEGRLKVFAQNGAKSANYLYEYEYFFQYTRRVYEPILRIHVPVLFSVYCGLVYLLFGVSPPPSQLTLPSSRPISGQQTKQNRGLHMIIPEDPDDPVAAYSTASLGAQLHYAVQYMQQEATKRRKKGAGYSIEQCWRRMFLAGFRVSLPTFRQFLPIQSGDNAGEVRRNVPRIFYDEVGEDLAEHGLCYPEGTPSGHRAHQVGYEVNPTAMVKLFWRVATSSTPLIETASGMRGRRAIYNGSLVNQDDSEEVMKAMREAACLHKYKGRRRAHIAAVEPPSEEELELMGQAIARRAKAETRPPTRTDSVRPLPICAPGDLDGPLHWLPFASPVACYYWYWRWGTTKDRVRAAVGAAAQWSMEAGKRGFVRLDDIDAVRWAWSLPAYEGATLTYGQVIERIRAQPALAPDFLAKDLGTQTAFRRQLVRLMAQALGLPDPTDDDFAAFASQMQMVRAKAQRLIERGDATPTVSTKQLFAWFAAEAGDA